MRDDGTVVLTFIAKTSDVYVADEQWTRLSNSSLENDVSDRHALSICTVDGNVKTYCFDADEVELNPRPCLRFNVFTEVKRKIRKRIKAPMVSDDRAMQVQLLSQHRQQYVFNVYPNVFVFLDFREEHDTSALFQKTAAPYVRYQANITDSFVMVAGRTEPSSDGNLSLTFWQPSHQEFRRHATHVAFNEFVHDDVQFSLAQVNNRFYGVVADHLRLLVFRFLSPTSIYERDTKYPIELTSTITINHSVTAEDVQLVPYEYGLRFVVSALLDATPYLYCFFYNCQEEEVIPETLVTFQLALAFPLVLVGARLIGQRGDGIEETIPGEVAGASNAELALKVDGAAISGRVRIRVEHSAAQLVKDGYVWRSFVNGFEVAIKPTDELASVVTLVEEDPNVALDGFAFRQLQEPREGEQWRLLKVPFSAPP